MLPVGACVLSSDLTISEWNATLASWTSISQPDAIGRKLGDLFPTVLTPRYYERLIAVIETGSPAVYSAALHKHFIPVPARNGIANRLMIQETEVRPMNGHNAALVIIRDVTPEYVQLEDLRHERRELVATQNELQLANQKLVAINKELDEFTHAASHDLQEPLRKITYYGQMCAELRDELPDDAANWVDEIVHGSQRMQKLISDLFALTRAGRSTLRMQPVNLDKCVDDVLNRLEMRIAETHAEFIRDPLPDVTGDPTMLTQLYQNLISNAIKFVKNTHPVIKLTANKEGSYWKMSIRDNGIGIDTKYRDQIFTPFLRLHTRAEYEGTGIGLSICKKYVERHGGQLNVQ